MTDGRLPKESFGDEGREVVRQKSGPYVRIFSEEKAMLTGSAVDSRCPQSSTRPVILPTARRERR
jgi:hypothetical protein